MIDVATSDGHCGILGNESCIHSTFVALTATEDVTHTPVAEQHITLIRTLSNSYIFYADAAAVDNNLRITFNTGQFAAAIDAATHRAGCHGDIRIIADEGRKGVDVCRIAVRHRLDISHGAVATTEDATEGVAGVAGALVCAGRPCACSAIDISTHHGADGGSVDDNLSAHVFARLVLARHSTELAATIDITLNPDLTTVDVQLGTLHTTQLLPHKFCDGVGSAAQLFTSTHAAAEDVAASGVVQHIVASVGIVGGISAGHVGEGSLSGVMLELVLVTDNDIIGAAVDVDVDMSATFGEVSCRCGIRVERGHIIILIVGKHPTIVSVAGVKQSITYGPQTTAAIDRAEHGAASDVDVDTAADITCRVVSTSVSTAATEDITIDV